MKNLIKKEERKKCSLAIRSFVETTQLDEEREGLLYICWFGAVAAVQ
jgi:hypothetical protein